MPQINFPLIYVLFVTNISLVGFYYDENNLSGVEINNYEYHGRRKCLQYHLSCSQCISYNIIPSFKNIIIFFEKVQFS